MRVEHALHIVFLYVGMSTLASREIRHHFGLKEQESVWLGEPPEKIIFATSSVRKAIIFSWALHDFSFDHMSEWGLSIKGPGLDGLSTPEEIQEYFNSYVFNGDMALTEPVFLGIYEGVPVWAYPQIGETESNENPVIESVNKVAEFQKVFEGENVLVISSDVVGTSSGYTSVDAIVKMGKPVNFKRQMESATALDALDVSEVPWTTLEEFVAWYKEVVFQIGAELGHLTGIAALNVADRALYTVQLELVQQVFADVHASLEVYMDAGLGGAWQQLQMYYNDSLIFLGDAVADIIPVELVNALHENEFQGEHHELLLEQFTYAHMIGVQVLAFLELLVGAQRQEIDVLAAQHGYEITLFEGVH